MKKALVAFCCSVFFVFSQSVTLSQITDEERTEGFVSIFNGQDLTGWEGHPAIWRVEDGVIVGQTSAEGPARLTYNQFLVWKGSEFDDFVLRFDIKCTRAGNSGMQFRSWINPDATKPFSVLGYQADLDGAHTYTGIFYGEGMRGTILSQRGQETLCEPGQRQPKEVRRFAEDAALKKELKVEDWNAYEVTAKDFTFTNKINGHIMSIFTDSDTAIRKSSGILAIQVHVGPPMKVEVKNMRIKKLK